VGYYECQFVIAVQQTSPDNHENTDITAAAWKCFKPGLMLRCYVL